MMKPVLPRISVEASVKTTDAIRLMIVILMSHLILVFFFIFIYTIFVQDRYTVSKTRNSEMVWMPGFAKVEWNRVCDELRQRVK